MVKKIGQTRILSPLITPTRTKLSTTMTPAAGRRRPLHPRPHEMTHLQVWLLNMLMVIIGSPIASRRNNNVTFVKQRICLGMKYAISVTYDFACR
jgi:hypothetical protein